LPPSERSTRPLPRPVPASASRLAEARRELELGLQAVDLHLEVQLPHALDLPLSGLLVLLHAERGVLVRQARERLAQLVTLVGGARLDDQRDDRLGELGRLELDGVGAVAQRVARRGVLHARQRHDVPGARHLERDAPVGVHAPHLRRALHAPRARVPELLPGPQRPGVDADERDVAVGARVQLEREAGERALGVGRAGRDRLAALRLEALDRRAVERRRQVRDDRVEQGLDADAAQRRAAEQRHERPRERARAQGRVQRIEGRVTLLEHRSQQHLVVVGERVDELRPQNLDLVPQPGRHLALVRRALGVERPRRAPQDVDHARHHAALVDRILDGHRMRREPLAHALRGREHVGPDAVALVDEHDARHAVALHLAPDRLRLRLDPGHRVDHEHGSVEHAHAALDLEREVDVAGRVDQVELRVLPGDAGRGRRDGDAALALLGHPVHRGRPLVDAADTPLDAGDVEDALGDRRLAGVDVRCDAEVAQLAEIHAGDILSNTAPVTRFHPRTCRRRSDGHRTWPPQ
jgi:hypothetical protein